MVSARADRHVKNCRCVSNKARQANTDGTHGQGSKAKVRLVLRLAKVQPRVVTAPGALLAGGMNTVGRHQLWDGNERDGTRQTRHLSDRQVVRSHNGTKGTEPKERHQRQQEPWDRNRGNASKQRHQKQVRARCALSEASAGASPWHKRITSAHVKRGGQNFASLRER
jgi:hypothetical protein